MRYTIIIQLIFILTCCLFSCSEETVGRQPVDSVPPGPVSNVTYVATPGGAVFKYDLPDDNDLLYVKAVFNRDGGVQSEALATIYADSLVIEGFGDTNPKTVQLYAVDRSMNQSTPYEASVTPLKPTVYNVGESLSLLPYFGEVRVFWENYSGEEFAITVMQKDNNGEYVPIERTYSTVEEGLLACRMDYLGASIDTLSYDLAVTVEDRWGHQSEIKYYDGVQPFFNTMFDKSKFREITLPGDKGIIASYPMSRMWNGNGRSDFMATQEIAGEGAKPITFDMGVLGQINRFYFQWAVAPDWVYRGGDAREMEIWGRQDIDLNDGSWDGWIKLYDYVSVKPSGLPKGQNTAEDLERQAYGEDMYLPVTLPKVRYIRLFVKISWADASNYQIAEVSIYGDNR